MYMFPLPFAVKPYFVRRRDNKSNGKFNSPNNISLICTICSDLKIRTHKTVTNQRFKVLLTKEHA